MTIFWQKMTFFFVFFLYEHCKKNDTECTDELYQIWQNLFNKKKGKIFTVQHGASYGDLFLQRSSIEFGFDKFISWGNTKHQNYDINFQPLPSPQLKINYKKNRSQNILFLQWYSILSSLRKSVTGGKFFLDFAEKTEIC